MMGNPALLVRLDFVGADIEAPIDGGGIAADDFAAMPQCQFDRERALACGCGTQDGQNGRTQNYNLKYASAATSASRIRRPSCCVLLTILSGRHLVVEERHGEERLIGGVLRREGLRRVRAYERVHRRTIERVDA